MHLSGRGLTSRGVWFRGVYLQGIWFCWACLQGVFFQGVCLQGVCLQGALPTGGFFLQMGLSPWGYWHQVDQVAATWAICTHPAAMHCWMHYCYRLTNEVCKGYIFTSICHSSLFASRGVCIQGIYTQGESASGGAAYRVVCIKMAVGGSASRGTHPTEMLSCSVYIFWQSRKDSALTYRNTIWQPLWVWPS